MLYDTKGKLQFYSPSRIADVPNKYKADNIHGTTTITTKTITTKITKTITTKTITRYKKEISFKEWRAHAIYLYLTVAGQIWSIDCHLRKEMCSSIWSGIA